METEISKLDDAVRMMLREDLPVQLSAVHSAIAQGDLVQAASNVHTIHGSAAFCRLESLRQAAATLEQSLKQNEKNAEQIRAFDNHVNAVLRLLDEQ